MKRVLICLSGIFVCFACNVQQKETPVSEDVFLSKISTGTVFSINDEKAVSDLPWNPHATFKGVYLKHVIAGKDTDDKLSYHIVKIEPECVLDTHSHDGKIEIHQIVAGSGKMYLNGKVIDYSQGQICIIPANASHKVVAGKNGMYILATFAPSLL
jgi:quercetin dioxygenase-like cupin family protein